MAETITTGNLTTTFVALSTGQANVTVKNTGGGQVVIVVQATGAPAAMAPGLPIEPGQSISLSSLTGSDVVYARTATGQSSVVTVRG